MKTKLLKYLRKLGTESVTVLAYFVSESTIKKIKPRILVYVILSIIMCYLAAIDLFLLVCNYFFSKVE